MGIWKGGRARARARKEEGGFGIWKGAWRSREFHGEQKNTEKKKQTGRRSSQKERGEEDEEDDDEMKNRPLSFVPLTACR